MENWLCEELWNCRASDCGRNERTSNLVQSVVQDDRSKANIELIITKLCKSCIFKPIINGI